MFRTMLLLLMCLLNGSLLTTHAQVKKVIIDTDPGVDGAMELVLALQSPQFVLFVPGSAPEQKIVLFS